jgi:uncharacterized protein YodC (DUF2158 family)
MDDKTEIFQIGAIVILNSGGPKMTVVRATEGEVRAMWFVDGISHRGIFPPACVGLYGEQEVRGLSEETAHQILFRHGEIPAPTWRDESESMRSIGGEE